MTPEEQKYLDNAAREQRRWPWVRAILVIVVIAIAALLVSIIYSLANS